MDQEALDKIHAAISKTLMAMSLEDLKQIQKDLADGVLIVEDA